MANVRDPNRPFMLMYQHKAPHISWEPGQDHLELLEDVTIPESLRTPPIVRWPGAVQGGSENQDLVQNLDFAQTFLDAAGAEIPGDMQGRSLVPLLRGEEPDDWRQAIYYHYYEHGAHGVPRHYGVRTARHKEYASVRRELEAEVRRLQEQYGVPEEDLTGAEEG